MTSICTYKPSKKEMVYMILYKLVRWKNRHPRNQIQAFESNVMSHDLVHKSQSKDHQSLE